MIGVLLWGWLATGWAREPSDLVVVTVVDVHGEPLRAGLSLDCAWGIAFAATDATGEAGVDWGIGPCELTVRAVGYVGSVVYLEQAPPGALVVVTLVPPREVPDVLPRLPTGGSWDPRGGAPAYAQHVALTAELLLREARPPLPDSLTFHRDLLARLPVSRSVGGVGHLAGAVGRPPPQIRIDGVAELHHEMPTVAAGAHHRGLPGFQGAIQ